MLFCFGFILSMSSVFSVQQSFQRFAAGAPVTRFYFIDHYIGAFGVFAQHVGQYLRNAFNKLLFLLLESFKVASAGSIVRPNFSYRPSAMMGPMLIASRLFICKSMVVMPSPSSILQSSTQKVAVSKMDEKTPPCRESNCFYY